MDEEDAAADTYLPYDGGGDTIPLQEIPKKGMQHPVIHFFSSPQWQRRTIYAVDANTAVLPLFKYWKSCSANVD